MYYRSTSEICYDNEELEVTHLINIIIRFINENSGSGSKQVTDDVGNFTF